MIKKSLKTVFFLFICSTCCEAFSQNAFDKSCYYDSYTMDSNMEKLIKLKTYLEKNLPDSVMNLIDKELLSKRTKIFEELKNTCGLISKNYRRFHVSNSTPTIANDKLHYIKLNYYDPKSEFITYTIIVYFIHKDRNSQIMDIKFEDHFAEFEKLSEQMDSEEPPPFEPTR